MKRLTALFWLFLLAWAAAFDLNTMTPEKWRQDLSVLARELPANHANAFHAVSKKQFEAEVAQIDRNLPKMRSDQALVAFMRLVAGVGDAHTMLGGWSGSFQQFPFQVEWLKDGWYVFSTTREYQDLIGQKLVRVGQWDMPAVEARVLPLMSFENVWWARQNAESLIPAAQVLHDLGLLSSAQQGVFTFERGGKRVSVTMHAQDAPALVVPKEVFAPLYLRDVGRPFWSETLQEDRVMYVRYNACEDPQGQFESFAQSVLHVVTGLHMQVVVIDLRQNTGGNSTIIEPLLFLLEQRLQEPNPPRVYGLTDRRTFSSGMQNALDLRRRLKATLVGEPTGEKPNSYGEIKLLTLPNSGLILQYPTKFFHQVEGDPPAVVPDVFITPGVQDVLSGRDPVLDWVLAQPSR